MPIELPLYVQYLEEEKISAYNNTILPDLVLAKTPGAAQRKWRTPTEFPCCPQNAEKDQISHYVKNLTTGAVFALNHFSTGIILESAASTDNQSIWVLCQTAEKDAMKPWSLAKITYENDLYVHESCGTFFTPEGAKKQFCLALGLEWTGGDTFDEFC